MYKRNISDRYRYLLIFSLILSLLLTGCSSGEQNKKSTPDASEQPPASITDTSDSIDHTQPCISVACSTEINMPDTIACMDGTEIRVLPYADNMLGSDHDMLLGCQANTISAFIGSSTVATDIVPELALLSIPFLCDNYDDYRLQIKDRWKNWFQPYFQKQDLQLLAWDATFKGCLVSQVPLRTADDLKQLNIRTTENPYRTMLWSSVGADVLPLSFDEIGYYLQTGQINALEGGISALIRSGLIESFRYIILLNHIPGNNAFVMNKDTYDSLSPEQQAAITCYAEKAVEAKDDIIDQCTDTYHLEKLDASEEICSTLYGSRDLIIEQLIQKLGEKCVTSFLKEVDYN